MHDDAYYMRLALEEAQKAYDLEEVPIGAVLVDSEGEVVARGHNMREVWHDATAHAEMIAIREACAKEGRWRLSGLTLYVTIEPCRCHRDEPRRPRRLRQHRREGRRLRVRLQHPGLPRAQPPPRDDRRRPARGVRRHHEALLQGAPREAQGTQAAGC